LFSHTQIVDEKFLIYINDTLSSGWIQDLFVQEDKDNIINSVRNECKASGIPDTRDNSLNFFIHKVKTYLHVVLCFSPIGDLFRKRALKFPALISCTSIDLVPPVA
jgi:dynein heavy chain